MPGFDDFPITRTIEEAFQKVHAIPSSMHEHMPFIRERAARATRILELGLNQGTSCVALLAGLKPGGEMVSVDIQGPLTPIRFIVEWAAEDVRNRNWMFMEADSLVAMRRLASWGMRFDLVFLDSSHQYAATVQELSMIQTILLPGGTILCHDTVSFPEVGKAVQEFATRTGWKYENRLNCHGLGVLSAP